MEKDFRTKMIGVRLSEKEFEMLNQVCQAMQITKSVFIRNLIYRELFE